MVNRLQNEQSPYLQQHADNPVDWQPWDEKALKEARKKDIPIFLSIGYSACHWCHVMEEESFEDRKVAEILNNNFVAIKVDREERPDIDRLYQTACQLSIGKGGWPLSIFLTPNGRPFYAGTYFPKEEKRGMPSFIDVLEGIKDMWENKRDEVENRADEWSSKLQNNFKSEDGESDLQNQDYKSRKNYLKPAANQAVNKADRKYGGFGSGTKFPQTPYIEVLFRAYKKTDNDKYIEIATEALDAMGDGGIRDHIGGGFHRYSTDRKWKIPHFEKMLYDNAELSKVYIEGYRITGNDRYRKIAEEVFSFLEREMKNKDGGFFSTLDARSQNQEGRFYIWTKKEIKNIIGEGKVDIFCKRYGVGENQVDGKSVLSIEKTIEEIAEEKNIQPSEIKDIIEESKKEILEAREKNRERPSRDEKIITEWNGLLISSLVHGSLVLEREKYRDIACETLDFIKENLWDGEKLYRRYKDGDVSIQGCLGDYSFIGRAALDLHGITGNTEYLDFAVSLGDKLIDEFWEGGSLYLSSEDLIVRPTEVKDMSTPSSTGGATQFLVKLSSFDKKFEKYIEKIYRKYSSDIKRNPLNYASLVLTEDIYKNPLEALIISNNGDIPKKWYKKIADISPDILSIKPSSIDVKEELKINPPLWEGRNQKNDRTTLYICSSGSCSPPIIDIDEGTEWRNKLT